MKLLNQRQFHDSPSKLPARTIHFVGKLTDLTPMRKVPTEKGEELMVADDEFVDQQGGKVKVGFWNVAIKQLQAVPLGAGVAIIGCSATKENKEIKLNIWPSAIMITDGDHVQSLPNLDTTGMQTEILRATFTPGADLGPLVEQPATPTCAKALADAVSQKESVVFQANRVLISMPVIEELIFAQDGRAYVKNCRVRDCTGSG